MRIDVAWVYMTYIRHFDNSATLKFAEEKNIRLPQFEAYLDKLIQYAIKDKWHRKRNVMQKLKARSKA